MNTVGCVVFKLGLLLCQPGDRFVETYVAGGWQKQEESAFLSDASSAHRALWNNLTNEKIEEAFADWGPRRHIPIDWSKVRGVKAP